MAWPMTSTIAAVLMSLVSVQLASAMDIKCSNPPPGVRILFRGVDITSLDMMPLDNVGDTGIKNAVLKFTCNRGKGWVNPKGGRYNDPDQTWVVQSVSTGSLSQSISTHRTSNDIKNTMAKNAGVGIDIGGFGFSRSGSYKKMQHTITRNSKYVNDVSAFESSTIMQLEPSDTLELDHNAQIYVDRFLKGKPFKTNKAVYRRFTKIFGTHYFHEGKFGGIMRTYMETTQSYVEQRSSKELTSEISASFWGALDRDLKMSMSRAQTSTNFEKNTQKTLKYYGGNVNLLKTTGLAGWQPSVDIDPYLITGKLTPIYEVVKDEAVKAELKAAMEEYVYRTYAIELLKEIMIDRTQGRTDYSDRYKAQVEAVLARDVIDKSMVDDLRAPEWFTRDTKLCYQWKATDANKAQCSGSTGASYCATANTYTKPYLDNSGGGNAGCKMQWSLHSTDNAAWFNNVQLCFKYEPTSDWGQCGGSSLKPKKDMCAPLNAYTPEYIDATNTRSGGCRMAWKLQIPNDAPFWMQTTKICMKFSPSNNNGRNQCNSGSSKPLCAESNKYTDWYLDDTDHRNSGGCNLSWGFMLGS